jgi:hypothetical protein
MRNSLPDRPCRLNRLACVLRRTTLALATALLLAVAPTAATANRCGTTNGGFNSHITVNGASCTTARAVTRAWLRSVQHGNTSTHRVVMGWSCSNTPIPQSSAAVHIRCTRGGAVIRWVAAP